MCVPPYDSETCLSARVLACCWCSFFHCLRFLNHFVSNYFFLFLCTRSIWYLCGKCSFATEFNKVDDIMSKSMLHCTCQKNVLGSAFAFFLSPKRMKTESFFFFGFFISLHCFFSCPRPYLFDGMIWYICTKTVYGIVSNRFNCRFLCVCVLSACMRLRQKLKDDVLTCASLPPSSLFFYLFIWLFVRHCIDVWICIVFSCTIQMNCSVDQNEFYTVEIQSICTTYKSYSMMYIYIFYGARMCMVAHLRSIFKFKFMTSTERS